MLTDAKGNTFDLKLAHPEMGMVDAVYQRKYKIVPPAVLPALAQELLGMLSDGKTALKNSLRPANWVDSG